MQTGNPVLEAISKAAQEIAAERQRLNNTFDGLMRSVMAYDPTATLDEHGNIASASEYKAVVEAGSKPIATDTEVAERQQRAQEFATGVREQLLREEAEASIALDKGDGGTQQVGTTGFDPAVVTRVQKLIANRLGDETHNGLWYSAKQVASMLKEPYNLVVFALNSLVGKGLERRAEAKASEGIQYRFPTPSPKPSAKPASSEPSTGSASKPATTEPSPATKTTATTTKPSTPSGNAPSPEGLARSPKPRSGMRPQQREAEARLDRLVLWMSEHPGDVNASDLEGDIPKTLGFRDRAQISEDLRTLEGRGVVKRTGMEYPRAVKAARKRSPNRGGGRPAITYQLADAIPPQRQAKPAASAPKEPSGSDNHETSAMRQVRDWFTKQKVGNVFSPGKIAEVTELDRELVLSILLQYVERGSLEDESPSPDMPLFSYIKPKSPGKAAAHDAKRSGGPITAGGTGPVAGTGKGQRAATAEVQAILDSVVRAGGSVEKTGKHWAVYIGGKRDIIAGTPNSSGLVKDRAKVRKMIAEAQVTA